MELTILRSDAVGLTISALCIMREHVALREMTSEEHTYLEQLARSRTAQARLVQRAQILLALRGGKRLSAVALRLRITRPTVYAWIARFNEAGIAGLPDRPRPGRPPTYTAEQRAEVIAAALTKPDELGLPFGSWTLDRLQAYLQEHQGIAITGQEAVRTAPRTGENRSVPAGRAKQEIDYGRRGKGYFFGAFRPATGQALTHPYDSRSAANWVDFLEKVEAWMAPEVDRVYAILDNLQAHRRSPISGMPLSSPGRAPPNTCSSALM